MVLDFENGFLPTYLPLCAPATADSQKTDDGKVAASGLYSKTGSFNIQTKANLKILQ